MNRRSFWSFAALAPVAMALRAQEGAPRQSYFDYEIERFLEQDKTRPPPQGGILFIGSSIFREWADLEKQMAPLPVFTRAFGGSRTWEGVHYADTIVLLYQRRLVVHRCSNQDGGSGACGGALGA